MAGPYGVVPEGFRRKLQQEILDEATQELRGSISAKINTSPASPTGQWLATWSREMALAWENLEACYDGIDRDRAEGEALDALGKLTGTPRPTATYSEVVLDCVLETGAELQTGVTIVNVDGEPDNRWTPKADFGPVASDATYEVTFRSENKGSFSANAGTITIIDTGPVGFVSCTNPEDAEEGREVAKDPEYRQVQEADVNRAGSTAARAIETDIRAIEVDGARPVVSVKVLENDTDIPGINGLPAHTIEAIVYDAPAVDNDLIAQAIYDSKAAGIGTQGSLFGFATLADGTAKQVFFSRATVREVYLTYDLTLTTGYVGDAEFKSAVVAELTARHRVGTDVFRWVAEYVGRQEGVENLSVSLGFAPSPATNTDLPISDREIADFDVSRVVIT